MPLIEGFTGYNCALYGGTEEMAIGVIFWTAPCEVINDEFYEQGDKKEYEDECGDELNDGHELRNNSEQASKGIHPRASKESFTIVRVS